MSISDSSVMSTTWKEMPAVFTAIKEENWSEVTRLLSISKTTELTLSFAHLKGRKGDVCPTRERCEDNKLRVEGAKAIAAALPHTPLIDLNLGFCALGAEGTLHIASVLSRSKLTYLNLYGNDIGDKGAIALAKVLPTAPLANLVLASNGIGDEGVKALAVALPNSSLRTRLSLGYGNISADGVKALAAALRQSSLADLDLCSNRIGAEGAQVLATALPESSLTSLDMSQNGIGDDGAAALASEVPNSKLLVSLRLHSNGITAVGAKALAAAIPSSKLTVLGLSEDSGEPGMSHVSESLGMVDKKSVRNRAWGIDKEQMSEIVQLLTKNGTPRRAVKAERAKVLRCIMGTTLAVILLLLARFFE